MLQVDVRSPSGEATPPTAARRPRLGRPGWALALVCVGYLAWWVVGVSSFIFLLAAVVMVLELAHRRSIRVPKGFGAWALLLLWVAAGVFVLNVDAPGAVPGDSPGRYLTWAYRLAWYLSATVAMVYVGNLREHLPLIRVSRILAWMFLATAVGGWLGILVPHLEFDSLIEHVLPRSITGSGFLNLLVHPEVVQLYAGAATDTARPSAPFAYSNIWGLNFACFLPFFVHAWMGRGAGRRRGPAAVILLVAMVPAVQSLNRGLWIALIVATVILAVRSALAGHVRLLALGVVGALMFSILLVVTPLGSLVTTRIDNPTSNDTRTSLGVATVESVVEGSPFVGFGTTRNVQGTFTSIAGGATAECPQCQPPALGTQGHLWLVVFSQGVIGLFFYLSFYLRLLWRTRKIRSDAVTVGMTALAAHLVTLMVYDSVGMSMIAVGIGAAYLWREEVRVLGPDQERALGAYLGLVRRHWLPVLTCMAVGLGGAAVWVQKQGRFTTGVVSIALPAEPGYLIERQLDLSIDDEGGMAHSSAVLAAMTARAGKAVTVDSVFVSADPSTRILNLRYVGPGRQRTADALNAAADVILSQRTQRLTADRKLVLGQLEARRASLTSSYSAFNERLAALDQTDVAAAVSQFSALRALRVSLRNQIQGVDATISMVSRREVQPGTIITSPSPTRDRDGMWVALTSGGMLGLLGGLLIAYRRDSNGPRARRRVDIYGRTGIPLLWYGSLADPARQRTVTARYPRAAFFAVDGSEQATRLAESLCAGSNPSSLPEAARFAVLLATPRTTLREISRVADRLRAGGHDVAGVIVSGASA